MTIITLYVNNSNNSIIDNNYHSQDRRIIPVSTRGRNQLETAWTRCRFVLMLRTGAKPRRTKLGCPASPQIPVQDFSDLNVLIDIISGCTTVCGFTI
jgi:hypothetical protein